MSVEKHTVVDEIDEITSYPFRLSHYKKTGLVDLQYLANEIEIRGKRGVSKHKFIKLKELMNSSFVSEMLEEKK